MGSILMCRESPAIGGDTFTKIEDQLAPRLEFGLNLHRCFYRFRLAVLLVRLFVPVQPFGQRFSLPCGWQTSLSAH